MTMEGALEARKKIPAENCRDFSMLGDPRLRGDDNADNYFTFKAPRSSLIVKFVTSQTSLGPQYWIGPG